MTLPYYYAALICSCYYYVVLISYVLNMGELTSPGHWHLELLYTIRKVA